MSQLTDKISENIQKTFQSHSKDKARTKRQESGRTESERTESGRRTGGATGKIAAGIFVLVLLFLFWSNRHDFSSDGKVSFNDTSAAVTELALKDGTIEQQLRCVADVENIDVIVSNSGNTPENIQVTLVTGEGEQIGQMEVEIPATEGEKTVVSLPVQTEGLQEEEGEIQMLNIQLDSLEKKSDVVFYTEPKGMYQNAYLTVITGTDEQLRMDVTYKSRESYRLFFGLALLLLLAGIVLLFVKKEWKIERIFFVTVIVTGVTLAMANPVCQECDGNEHLLRAMDVSYGNLLSPFVHLTHEAEEIIVPTNLDELSLRGEIAPYSGYGSVQYERLRQWKFSEETETVDFFGGVNSIFYWPQGLGFFLGRSLGLAAFWCSALARVCNLLCYSLLVYVAIRKMPFAKTLMAVIALLPISVYQAASYSPDAALNGLCLLFIAISLSYAYGEQYEGVGKLNWKHGMVLGLLLAILFLCKYVYVVLGLLVFLIPKERFGTTQKYAKAFGIALIPLLLAAGLIAGGLTASVAQSQSADGTDLTQMQFVMQNPLAFVKTILRTVEENAGLWISGFATYGWMSYSLGMLVYLIPVLIMVTGLMEMKTYAGKLKDSHRVILGLAFLGTFVALLSGLYIGDGRINPVGALTVSGIQGRYFVPLLILPFLALGSKNVEHNVKCYSQRILGIEAIMLVYSIVQLMEYCY